jgi:VWA / Hh  protein intein-like
MARMGEWFCRWLQEELNEMARRMSTRKDIVRFGRAYTLPGLSDHTRQHATTRSLMSSVQPEATLFGGGGPSVGYQRIRPCLVW